MNEQTEVYALTNTNGKIMCHKDKGFMIFLEREDADAAVTDKNGNENALGKKWTVETFTLEKNISSKPLQYFVQHYMPASALIKGAMWLNDLRDMVDEGKPVPKKKVKTDIDKIREKIAAKKAKLEESKAAEKADKKAPEKKARPDDYDEVETLRNTLKEAGENIGNLRNVKKLRARVEAMYVA